MLFGPPVCCQSQASPLLPATQSLLFLHCRRPGNSNLYRITFHDIAVTALALQHALTSSTPSLPFVAGRVPSLQFPAFWHPGPGSGMRLLCVLAASSTVPPISFTSIKCTGKAFPALPHCYCESANPAVITSPGWGTPRADMLTKHLCICSCSWTAQPHHIQSSAQRTAWTQRFFGIMRRRSARLFRTLTYRMCCSALRLMELILHRGSWA